MDTEMKMKCPHCGMDITLDELFKTQMGKKMEGERAKIAEEILKGRDEETNQKIASAVKEATEEQGKKITELLEQIKRLTDANQKATEKMQEMAQTQFELQQKLQNVQLDEQTKFNEKSDELVQKTRKETEELIGGKLALAEQKIKELSKSLEESQRKLEQGSQQLQGEVQELQLEDCLHQEFPMDRIEEVEKGKLGADVIQTVVNDIGKPCGVIVWESKNVKGWKNEFIPKLRSDMEKVNGDLGVLVSNVFGKNMEEFTYQDGVWLIRPSNVLAIARALRNEIIAVSKARAVAEHKETVQDAVYEFVTSATFRNRIENIGKQYIALKDAIYRAKVHMDREWGKQMTMLDNLVENTQGILGDVDAFLLQSSEDNLQLEAPEEEPDSEDE
ncbi:DUF2130 domain-containing protein [Methanomethylophilus alvi]|uniref:DUF2130 domain-containing protein n=1 Tax=Methanomethylophilus alvi TaxID=1291540 RepID=UPI0037DD906C